MDAIIKMYLDKNYSLNLRSLLDYRVFGKENNEYLSIKDFMVTMKTIFGVSDDEFQEIWDEWVDTEISTIGVKIDKLTSVGLKVSDIGVCASDSTLTTTIEIISDLIEKSEK